MKTFKDYLIYYNNKDVEPFVTALNNHARFFRERGLDMFKDGISLPGLTLRFLFKDIDYSLCDFPPTRCTPARSHSKKFSWGTFDHISQIP